MNAAQLALLTAELAKPAYAEMTDAEKLAAINAKTEARPVALGILHQALDNMADGQGVPVWEAIEAGTDGAAGFNIACRAAVRLRSARADYPDVDVTSPMFAAQLAALVAGGALTQAQADAVTALGANQRSVAEALGLGLVKPGHVELAVA